MKVMVMDNDLVSDEISDSKWYTHHEQNKKYKIRFCPSGVFGRHGLWAKVIYSNLSRETSSVFWDCYYTRYIAYSTTNITSNHLIWKK